jgi:hypothetical protein
MRSNLIHGGSVSLNINGKKYGNVVDFHFRIGTPMADIRGIDATEPFELAVTTTSVSGSLSMYRQSQDGGAEGAGLTVTLPEISRQSYFSMMLIEEHSNTVLFEARRCSVEDQAWAFATKQLVVGAVNWRALEWSNEVRPLTSN